MIGRYSISFLLLITVLLVVGYQHFLASWGSTRIEETLDNPGVQHLGIIMDGNRRWARSHGHKIYLGHRYGVEPVKTTIQCCLDYKIPYLTLYAFSLENFKRSPDELKYLFEVLAQEIFEKELEDVLKEKVRVRFIGDHSQFPTKLLSMIDDVEHKTVHNKALQVDILFCYGGQQEIVDAAKMLVHKVTSGEIAESDITESLFADCLWSAPTPPPDLIIRSGGDKRLSNFLTYKAAYTELYFIDCYWPDIKREHLVSALQEFQHRKRNFGA
jgi:undecaprenyl diphosphate synthase